MFPKHSRFLYLLSKMCVNKEEHTSNTHFFEENICPKGKPGSCNNGGPTVVTADSNWGFCDNNAW